MSDTWTGAQSGPQGRVEGEGVGGTPTYTTQTDLHDELITCGSDLPGEGVLEKRFAQGAGSSEPRSETPPPPTHLPGSGDGSRTQAIEGGLGGGGGPGMPQHVRLKRMTRRSYIMGDKIL